MTIITHKDAPYSTVVRKKIGNADEPDPPAHYGIYQMRHCKAGILPIRMKFYEPFNPQTIPQQANRGKFAAAVLAWQNLTQEQKAVYNSRAVGKHMSGYNIFIKQSMLS